MLRRFISKTTWVYFLILIGMIIYVLNDMSLAYHQFDLYDTSDPRTVFYWHVYHTTTDMTKALLAIGLFLNINYGRVVEKLLSAVVAAWFVILGSILLISDYAFLVGLVDAGEFLIPDGSLVYVWVFIAATLLVVGYRILAGTTNFETIPIDKSNLYLIRSKASDISQYVVAALTGKGGSFAITDGETVWKYKAAADSLIEKPLESVDTTGKGIELICAKSDDHIDYLSSQVGNRFSSLNTSDNCIGLLTLARRWQEERNE